MQQVIEISEAVRLAELTAAISHILGFSPAEAQDYRDRDREANPFGYKPCITLFWHDTPFDPGPCGEPDYIMVSLNINTDTMKFSIDVAATGACEEKGRSVALLSNDLYFHVPTKCMINKKLVDAFADKYGDDA